jgi:hypothetical protein
VIDDIAVAPSELIELLRAGSIEEAFFNYYEMLRERSAADGRHRDPIIVNPTSNHPEGDSKF